MEFEVFGTLTPNMPAPPTVTSSVVETNVSTEPRNATIAPDSKVTGKTVSYTHLDVYKRQHMIMAPLLCSMNSGLKNKN